MLQFARELFGAGKISGPGKYQRSSGLVAVITGKAESGRTLLSGLVRIAKFHLIKSGIQKKCGRVPHKMVSLRRIDGSIGKLAGTPQAAMKCFRVALITQNIALVFRFAGGPIERLLHSHLIVDYKCPVVVIGADIFKLLYDGLIYSGFGFIRTIRGKKGAG